MKISLTPKLILAIAALLIIPASLAFGATIFCDSNNCQGTEFQDIIVGTSGKETINGKDGNDIIMGLGSPGAGGGKPETLRGGGGNDELVGDADILGLCAAEPTCTIGTRSDIHVILFSLPSAESLAICR